MDNNWAKFSENGHKKQEKPLYTDTVYKYARRVMNT